MQPEDLSGSDRARFEKMDPKEQREMLAEAYKFEKPCPEVNVTPEVRQEDCTIVHFPNCRVLPERISGNTVCE